MLIVAEGLLQHRMSWHHFSSNFVCQEAGVLARRRRRQEINPRTQCIRSASEPPPIRRRRVLALLDGNAVDDSAVAVLDDPARAAEPDREPTAPDREPDHSPLKSQTPLHLFRYDWLGREKLAGRKHNPCSAATWKKVKDFGSSGSA